MSHTNITHDGGKQKPVRVVIIGGGFAGLNAAKRLGNKKNIRVALIDKKNHHVFSPLLYQVATAGLSPADIAVPLRAILSKYRNIEVYQAEVTSIDDADKTVSTTAGTFWYDYLIIGCGVRHTYFGNESWEVHAPGLKTIEQALEIRRRILSAFEVAEATRDPDIRARNLTFVIVGGGPTGVELAGAIAEISRFTLAKDFKRIDPRLARIFLIEAGPRILPAFHESLSAKATRFLEAIGVQVWTGKKVTGIDENGVDIGNERIEAAVKLWAAGVKGIYPKHDSDDSTDESMRIFTNPDLSLPGRPHIFVAGDLAHPGGPGTDPLPALAPVALQEGIHAAGNILADVTGKERKPFVYKDKGQMATIGRRRAVITFGPFKGGGLIAWFLWLFVHIFYLIGFKNRISVMLQWAYAYMTFRRGARLITENRWRFYEPVDPGQNIKQNIK